MAWQKQKKPCVWDADVVGDEALRRLVRMQQPRHSHHGHGHGVHVEVVVKRDGSSLPIHTVVVVVALGSSGLG